MSVWNTHTTQLLLRCESQATNYITTVKTNAVKCCHLDSWFTENLLSKKHQFDLLSDKGHDFSTSWYASVSDNFWVKTASKFPLKSSDNFWKGSWYKSELINLTETAKEHFLGQKFNSADFGQTCWELVFSCFPISAVVVHQALLKQYQHFGAQIISKVESLL